MSNRRLRPNDRIVFREMGEDAGGVLLNLESGEYRQLNTTGAAIWSLLSEGPTRDELVAKLRSRVENPPATIEAEVDSFIASLAERGLIAEEEG